jgi:hypothetical protein
MDEGKKSPALMHSMKSVGDDSKSLADMEAKINAMPQVMALYRKHDLSAHDVVVMPFVLMDAGMAAQYPSAAVKLSNQMSSAQVAFYKQHQGGAEESEVAVWQRRVAHVPQADRRSPWDGRGGHAASIRLVASSLPSSYVA